MGQKTNPNILRLSKTTDWASKYIEKKSRESYLQTAKDLEIKKFTYQFFKNNGLIIHSCKINYSDNSLQLFITYHQSVNSTSILSNINKSNKIKLAKLTSYKKAIYSNVIKNVEKIHTYENLSYKKNTLKLANNKLLKLKRLRIIKYYKKYLNLKSNKIIKNTFNNNFLNKFLQSLTLFYPNQVVLILKPLNSNNLKNMGKKQMNFLKRKLIKIKKYQRNDFFNEGVNLVFSSISNKYSADLVAKYITSNLKKLKRHNFFLRFLKAVLNIFIIKNLKSEIAGVKIKLKGRLNGIPRAKHKTINVGENMPILTINSNIRYAESVAYTANGTIGVKVWVSERKKENIIDV